MVHRFAMAITVAAYATGAAAGPMHRCLVNGTVTFQQGPCAGDPAGRRPTVQDRTPPIPRSGWRSRPNRLCRPRRPTAGPAASALPSRRRSCATAARAAPR